MLSPAAHLASGLSEPVGPTEPLRQPPGVRRLLPARAKSLNPPSLVWFSFQKFKEYLNGSNLITKLQAKHDLLKQTLGEGESQAESREEPPSTREGCELGAVFLSDLCVCFPQ